MIHRQTTASLDMGGIDSAAWQRACRELADAYPRYQVWRGRGDARQATGAPDYYHILGAALKCGCELVTGNNYELVLAAIRERAERQSKEEDTETRLIPAIPTLLDSFATIQE